MKILDESQSEWVETTHPRVFYRSEDDLWNRGEFALSSVIADHLPGWTIVVEMGPNRDTELMFEIYYEKRLIHLDCDVDGTAAYRAFESEHSRQKAEFAVATIIQHVRSIQDLI